MLGSFNIKIVHAILTGGQDRQTYFCSFFSNYEVTWGGVVFRIHDLGHLCYLDFRML